MKRLGKKLELTSVPSTSTSRSPPGPTPRNEKAAYARETFRAIEERIGKVHPASCIVLDEVPADGWGYAGETQESRYVRAKAM